MVRYSNEHTDQWGFDHKVILHFDSLQGIFVFCFRFVSTRIQVIDVLPVNFTENPAQLDCQLFERSQQSIVPRRLYEFVFLHVFGISAVHIQ